MRTIIAVVVGIGAGGCVIFPDSGDDDGAGTEGAEDDDGADGADDSGGYALLPPVLYSVTPTRGPHGTLVTLEGENLFGIGDPRLATLSDEYDFCCVAIHDPAVVSWDDERIELNWPFPATGTIELTTIAGSTQIDGFVPEVYEAGPVWDAGASTTRLASVPLDDGSIAMVVRVGPSAQLVQFRDDEVVSDSLGAAGFVSHASLYLDDQARPSGYLLREDVVSAVKASRRVFELRWEDDTPVVLDTGVDTSYLDAFVAAGRDLEGTYAWVRVPDAAGVQRVRGQARTWMPDRGPIVPPSDGTAANFATVADDGTLYMSWADVECVLVLPIPPVFDCDHKNGNFAMLHPEDDAFAITSGVFGGNVDRTRLRVADDGRVFFTVCVSEVEDFYNHGKGCRTSVRALDGTWAELEAPADAEVLGWHTFAPGPGGSTWSAYCGHDLALRIADLERTEGAPAARWPCGASSGEGILGDLWVGETAAHLLTEWEDQQWFRMTPTRVSGR